MTISPEVLKNIKGFLDPDEGRRLYEIARSAAKIGPCLEIGSYCGKSTVYLGRGCKEHRGILFSIDHHKGSEEQQPGEEYYDPDLYDSDTGGVNTFSHFQKTLETADLEDTVVPMVCRSEVAARMWNTPLGLVFIDGGHSFEAAFTDYNAWAGHIMPKGYLLIHDIFKDPREGGQAPHYIYKLALGSGLFEALPMTRTLGILQRRSGDYIPPAF
jgi:hypothetical protein